MGAGGTEDEWVRVEARTAAEVVARFEPGESAKGRLRDDMTPGQYLELLVDAGEYVDATRFLGHALPRREAAWWACLCARRVADAKAPAAQLEALDAAEAWVADPNEDRRRAAGSAAELAGYGTPAGCAAASAFWSGGSLGPPHVPPIPPGDDLTAHGASCAVMLAAVTSEPEKAPEKYLAFLALGVELARGQHPWPSPPEPAVPSHASDSAPAPPEAPVDDEAQTGRPTPPDSRIRNLKWE